MATQRSTKLRVAMGLVAAALALAAWWAWGRAPQGFVVSLSAIDAHRAVVCTRHNPEHGAARAWVSLVHDEDGVVWTQELPGTPLSASDGGVSVSEGLVSVRYSHAGTVSTRAFRLETGELRWDVPLIQSSTELGYGSHAAGARVIEALSTWNGYALAAIDSQTGQIVWETETANVPMRVSFVGDLLVREDVFAVVFQRLAGGGVEHHETLGPGCLVGDRYFHLARRGQRVVLVRHDLGAELRTFEFEGDLRGQSGHLGEEVSSIFSRACGTRNDRLVFSLDVDRGASETQRVLLALDPTTGAHEWTLALGPAELNSPTTAEVRDLYVGAAPFFGELTRFVPVIAHESRPSRTRLIVVDLDERSTRAGAPNEELIYYVIFRSGTHYVVSGGSAAVGRMLGVFDGDSGELRAAMHMPVETQRSLPRHTADEVLWTFARLPRSIAEPAVGVFDLATLEPLDARDAPVEDARPELLELLGLTP